MCLQQAQGSERTGKAETAHWLSEGSLSPVWWGRRTETWPKKTHGCQFWNHAWLQQLGRFIVCMVSSILDAPCSGCHKGKKSFAYNQVVSQLGAVAFTDQTQTVLPEGLDFTYKVKRWQADARGCCPVLQSRINVDWLTFDPQMFTPLFPRLKEGILRDVFIQKAVWPGTTPLIIALW